MERPELIIGAIIAAAVLIGVGRLVWRERAVGVRLLALAALAAASGALLWLTLFPPQVVIGGETLLVATADAPRALKPETGERLIALPEAPPLAEAERVPDLATALRRHPQATGLRVIGAGLTARDRDATGGLKLAFAPPAVPRGLVELTSPERAAAGSSFSVAGLTQGLGGGAAELRDPAGRRVDAVRIGEDGRFALLGTARTAGAALFTLRLTDAGKARVSDTPVPLWTVPDQPIRVLLLGAPGPETKYLRRWASDAGIDLTSPLEAGGGVRIGDAPVSLDGASLRRFDAVILDDRTWQGLGGGVRSALSGAVGGGLGLVLRLSGPASPALRRDWAALGLPFAGGAESAAVKLPPLALDADALAALRGPEAEDEAGAESALDDPAPDLARWAVTTGAQVVPLLRDDSGALLAGWRARGQGRVALFAVADSYALVLAGQEDRYFQWWSDLVTTVARADRQFVPELPPVALAGERATVCGLDARARVIAPGGSSSALLIDPAAGPRGCAAWWPGTSGFHTIAQPGADGERRFAYYVHAPADLHALAAYRMRQATIALSQAPGATRRSWSDGARGPAWPWFLAWLMASALLWWLERRPRRAAQALPSS